MQNLRFLQHSASTFEWLSWEDMGLMYPLATSAVRAVAPDAWVVCETYSHPQPYTGPDKPPKFGDAMPAWAAAELARFPRGVFVQWVADYFMKNGEVTPAWTAEGSVSNADHRHVMRSHLATSWFGNRGELAVDWLANLVQRSMTSGFEGISLFGEVSSFHAGAELNYLALADYGGLDNLRQNGVRLGHSELTACREVQATALAHQLSDVVGRRSAGPTLRIHKLASRDSGGLKSKKATYPNVSRYLPLCSRTATDRCGMASVT